MQDVKLFGKGGWGPEERENYPTEAEYTFLVKTFIEIDYILGHKTP